MQRKIDLVKAMGIFMAVVDAKSFSGASGKVNLATSAVSKNVSDLEAYYGCKLLHRNTRTMHLTAEGEHFLVEFKRILHQLDALKMGLSQRQEKIAGRLKITSPENAQGLGIDKKISAFIRLYPDVKVSWLQQNRHVNIVDEGVDVAIRVGKLEDSNLIVQQFAQVENFIVASPEYLQKYGTPAHPNELSQYPCIIEVANRQPLRWPYIENGQLQSVTVSGMLELDKGETVAYFAAQGHGIARLPRFMMQDYLDSGALVPILQGYNTQALDISMVYPQNSLNNPALTAFTEFIRAGSFKDR